MSLARLLRRHVAKQDISSEHAFISVILLRINTLIHQNMFSNKDIIKIISELFARRIS